MAEDTQNDNYQSLTKVFKEAFEEATVGKGKERHAENVPIEKQLTLLIEKADLGFLRGQAVKKLFESKRLEKPQAIKELLDAINYSAFKIISLRDEEE